MQGWAREAGYSITNIVGIDVSKRELVVVVSGHAALRRYTNDAAGRRRLCRDLAKIVGTGTLRAGLEASGGYERKVAAALRKAGFEVIVFQPIQVRAYAQYLGQRAKTDPIDAHIIALATAAYEGEIRHSDERLSSMAEHLTFIEQTEEDIVRLKTRLDGFTDTALKTRLAAEIKCLTTRRKCRDQKPAQDSAPASRSRHQAGSRHKYRRHRRAHRSYPHHPDARARQPDP